MKINAFTIAKAVKRKVLWIDMTGLEISEMVKVVSYELGNIMAEMSIKCEQVTMLYSRNIMTTSFIQNMLARKQPKRQRVKS